MGQGCLITLTPHEPPRHWRWPRLYWQQFRPAKRLTEKLRAHCGVVNLDALTYAGNLANLADLAGDPRYVFAQGDIGDPALSRPPVLSEHAIERLRSTLLPNRTWTGRSIRLKVLSMTRPTLTGRLRIAQWRAAPLTKLSWSRRKRAFRLPACALTDELARGSLAPGAAGLFTEELAILSRIRLMPLPRLRQRTAWCAPTRQHLRPAADAHHQLSLEQRRPVSFSRETDPASMILQCSSKANPLPVYGDGQQIREWL